MLLPACSLVKEALKKWLRGPLAALRELLRCSSPYKLRSSKSARLADAGYTRISRSRDYAR
jgi:hypothetical protein